MYRFESQRQMPPRSRQRNTAQETPPAPEDPVLGMRTRQAGRNAGASPSDIPPPPTAARTASSGDQARGFAGLSGNQATRPGRSTGAPKLPVVNPAQAPAGARSAPQTILPQTPARRAVHGLVDQLAQQAAMASPGPRLCDLIHASSDVEDSDGSEEFPVVVPRQRPLRTPALSSAAESDDENPPPRKAAVHKKASGRRRGRGAAAAPTHAETADDDEAGSAYVFIDPETLVKTKKSADSDYFFGRRAIDKGFKCRLCPQEYGTGSSLTTRRLHLQNTEGHMEAYLAAVQKYGFTNKLPECLQQQAEEQRIVNAQRVPFSMAAFREQLVKVFVSNDLSIHLIESRDFRDLLLLLRESLTDKEIPHRTKLTKLVLEAWDQYYVDLKAAFHASIGKISFTADIWSSKGMDSYLAITAHWLGPKGCTYSFQHPRECWDRL
ncbi:hypothetical protein FB451DRAFT_1235276 [Mycena latifolia]|nr:hypothetical protein FB451DRAFT_1235276 [Mycena latifolia]